MMEKNTIEQYKEGNRISDEADENNLKLQFQFPPLYKFYLIKIMFFIFKNIF